MKTVSSILAGLLVAVLALVAYPAQPARAIEGESIVISPASLRTSLDAGETIKKSFKVINDGTVGYDFIVYASPYSVSSGNYLPNYEEEKPNADLYTWVKFEKTRYHLDPGENVDVAYTIQVPADASPGGHYGVIFAETEVTEDSSDQIARKKRVGSVIYSTINGEVILSGRQIDAKIDWLQLGGPLSASMTIENDGNSDFMINERIRIKNVLGGTVYEKTAERIMLPKTTRDIQLAWAGGPIMGLYQVAIESDVLDKTVTTESWVLLLPAWLLVVMILAIAGIIYYGFIRRRRQ